MKIYTLEEIEQQQGLVINEIPKNAEYIVELEESETADDLDDFNEFDSYPPKKENSIFVRFAGYTCNLDSEELEDCIFYSKNIGGMAFKKV